LLRLLHGELDDVLNAYLRLAPTGRRLDYPDQTKSPGIYDDLAPRRWLLPLEIDPHPRAVSDQRSANRKWPHRDQSAGQPPIGDLVDDYIAQDATRDVSGRPGKVVPSLSPDDDERQRQSSPAGQPPIGDLVDDYIAQDATRDVSGRPGKVVPSLSPMTTSGNANRVPPGSHPSAIWSMTTSPKTPPVTYRAARARSSLALPR